MKTTSADDEGAFRPAPLNSSAWAAGLDRPLGRFDPRTLTLWLSEGVASALDRRGGTLPAYSIESSTSEAMRGFSTHLHETIHLWQSVGSTAGLLFALSDATAALATLHDLRESGHRRKPILGTLPSDVSPDAPARRACLRWGDIERGRLLLNDPRQTAANLQDEPGGFVSLGHSLMSLCVHTASTLASGFDPGHAGLLDPEPWHDAYDHMESAGRSGFERGVIVEVPIGLAEIQEGQARVSEIQHRDLTQEPITWALARSRGWLKGTYGRAFDLFLRLAELPEPESPRDGVVNLFLLLCDIAINPAAGYADAIDPSREFVHDFHPGVRFMRLCRAVLDDVGLVAAADVPSHSMYESSCKRLCDRLDWKTPTEVARTLLARWEQSRSGDELLDRHHTREYGSVDTHRRFVLGEHLSFLQTRSQIPHFFCWPAWSLLAQDDEQDYAATINEVLGWHRPPFIAEEGRGVTSLEIARLPADRVPQFLSDYFATIALYDLSRQWISKSGPFRWNNFTWKETLSPTDVERLKVRFEVSFGVSIDEIVTS